MCEEDYVEAGGRGEREEERKGKERGEARGGGQGGSNMKGQWQLESLRKGLFQIFILNERRPSSL